MNVTKIWYRYLFREILKVFFLCLGAFFFLYSLIDYSLHMQDFIIDKKMQLSHLFTYYGFQFIKRSEVLIPLSLLIATLKVLFTMNARKELLALQASGLPLKKILSPFFSIALLCLLFNWVSSEVILPSSLNYLDRFRADHFKHSQRGQRKEPVHVLPLKDHSKIVYQKQDKEKNALIDVFWIQSVDEIWRMQSLSFDSQERPTGHFVDHLKRNTGGEFEKVESFDTYPFAHFKWEKDPTGKGGTPLENRKMTELFKLVKSPNTSVYERAQALSQLLFKCTLPLLSFSSFSPRRLFA